MTSKDKGQNIYLRGTIYWAKIFNDPRPGYARPGKQPTFREWTFEFEPEDLKTVKKAGLEHKLKDKSDKKGYEGRAPFMQFRRKEFNRKGELNKHIRVVDANDQPWPDKTLIGNGSKVDVKLSIFPDPDGDQQFDSVYAQAIRVLELVPYQSADFQPLAEDDPYKKEKKDTFAEDFDLEAEETQEGGD